MEKPIERIQDLNLETVENFFNEAKAIIYSQKSIKSKMRALHSAHHWAVYFAQMSNHFVETYLQEK